MFLGFANFYQQFTQELSTIATVLISMLRTTIFETTIELKNKKKEDKGEFDNEVVGENNRSLYELVEAKKDSSFEKKFLTPKAKLAFTRLRQAFSNTSIFHYFLPKLYMCIKTNVLGYTISRIISQLILNQYFSDLVYNAEILNQIQVNSTQ